MKYKDESNWYDVFRKKWAGLRAAQPKYQQYRTATRRRRRILLPTRPNPTIIMVSEERMLPIRTSVDIMAYLLLSKAERASL